MTNDADLAALCKELMRENEQLKEQIDAYVREFQVCRFCSGVHENCTPTGGNCHPHWRGL